jgi:hypothetical protein
MLYYAVAIGLSASSTENLQIQFLVSKKHPQFISQYFEDAPNSKTKMKLRTHTVCDIWSCIDWELQTVTLLEKFKDVIKWNLWNRRYPKWQYKTPIFLRHCFGLPCLFNIYSMLSITCAIKVSKGEAHLEANQLHYLHWWLIFVVNQQIFLKSVPTLIFSHSRSLSFYVVCTSF